MVNNIVEMGSEIVIQTRVSLDLVKALKVRALKRDKRLKDVCAESVSDFLEHREAFLDREISRPLRYFASPRNGIEFNLRLPALLAKHVRRIADRDGVAGSRVLYTSLVHYAEKNRLLGR